jgi:signal transduction histidine kinase
MNPNLKPFPNAVFGEAPLRSDMIARPAGRIQGNSPRPDQQQVGLDLKIRLEERRKERGRIARELHDTLLQGFLGASMLLQGAVEQTPTDSPTKPSLSRVLRLMQRAMEEGRVALQELRSSANAALGIEEALYGLWEELSPGNAQFRILVEGQPKALEPAIQEQIYLLVREAVLNALRHSGASAIEVELEYSPRLLRVAVRDNGCGIDPQIIQSGRDSHWGLLGMRERAECLGALLRIWSRPDAGTEVEISVPIQFGVAVHAELSTAYIAPKDERRLQDASSSPV